jgi:hypothetical protein
MLSNHCSETLQKPNAKQRFSRLPSYNSISNAHPASDGAGATEQVEKIMAVKISCEKNCSSSNPTVLQAKSSKVKTADPKCHQPATKSISISPLDRPTD